MYFETMLNMKYHEKQWLKPQNAVQLSKNEKRNTIPNCYNFRTN